LGEVRFTPFPENFLPDISDSLMDICDGGGHKLAPDKVNCGCKIRLSVYN
jgi:hypothetical protein